MNCALFAVREDLTRAIAHGPLTGAQTEEIETIMNSRKYRINGLYRRKSEAPETGPFFVRKLNVRVLRMIVPTKEVQEASFVLMVGWTIVKNGISRNRKPRIMRRDYKSASTRLLLSQNAVKQ